MPIQTEATQPTSATEVLADYVTREQLARELRVTTKTLDRWSWLSHGPVKIKVGSRVYYHRADVRAWLDSQRLRAQEAA
jgi:hypothetical protein